MLHCAVHLYYQGRLLLHEAGAVPWLCRLTGDMQATARDAIRALINIGADVSAAMEDMARAGVINGVMEVAAEQEQVCALCLLLTCT